MKIILFVFITISVYLFVENMYEKRILNKINKYINKKNELYYKEFLKKYEKSKKIKITEKFNFKYKINMLLDKADIEQTVFINPFSLIFYSFLCFLIIYIIVFDIFKILGLAFIIALPCCTIPFVILNFIVSYKLEKIEKVFLNFLLQLKNYTQISNDVISALKNIETIDPLQSYIDKFNLEINSGIKFEIALEHLKEKISIIKFKEFFSNVQYCYIFGGNFANLIDKSYQTINELQKEKSKRKQETQGARIVLFILMLLDIFVYINFVKNDYENYIIMRKSFIGNLILYWNFISMWFLIYLSEKVKKLDY